MPSHPTRISKVLGIVMATTWIGLAAAQQTPPPAPQGATHALHAKDPRVGLKGGIDDAAVAAKGVELVGHLPKPEAFEGPRGSLSFANSDMAFQGPHLFLGNFHGLNFYNVEDPRRPLLKLSMPCPGGQGDVSVFRNLLFMSVEEARGRVDCGTQGVQGAASPERFRGVRIFDISNLETPKQIAAVQTCRGSHTHSLIVDPDDKENIYLYASGTSGVRSGDELAGCSAGQPKDNPDTAMFSIDVILVPLKAPETAKIVNRPRIFADPSTGSAAGLWAGGSHGEGTQTSSQTNQCHDITVFPEKGLAAGACSGNGILLDISDPVNPKRLDAAVDKNFAYWHSATFNNDGTKIIFTDEWGGGTSPRCRMTDLLTWGANAVFDIVEGKLVFGGYFKMPAPQTPEENCVAHNGSLIPVPGRDIMAQAWYQGGMSIFDFTDSKNPVEIAYFDRGPYDPEKVTLAGYWSTYYYNGFIYGSEIGRGLDIFKLVPAELLSQNEIDAAGLVRMGEFNAQQQPRVTWPPSFVVAKAYVDQLVRSNALAKDRAATLVAGMDAAESSSGRTRTAVLDQLEKHTTQLVADTATATGRDALRFRALVDTIRARIAQLR